MPKTIDRAAELRGTECRRDLPLEVRAADEDARTLELAFSSEAPVERYWGFEILDHSPGAVRLGRLTDGAALLLQHDGDRQIGVVESAGIKGDRRGRATVRFSRWALGEEIYRDVIDGIRRQVSVGYRIHEVRMEGSRDGAETYRVTDWEPLEISIVSTAADASVGVGRSIHSQSENIMPDQAHETPAEERDELREPQIETQTRARPSEAPAATADQAEMRRIGAHFGLRDMAEDHVMIGTGLDEFRALVKAAMAERIQPVPVCGRVEASIPRRSRSLTAFRPDLYRDIREADEAAFRVGQWARGLLFNDAEALRWCKDHQVRVMTGLSGGTSALVPDEMILPLIDLREQYGIARRLCYVVPMASDIASVPRRKSGVTAYFTGREDATTASDAGFDDINLVARELSALTRISNSYMADSVIDLADHITQEMAYAFAVKEDACLINGDGTSTYGGIVGIRPGILGLAGAVDAASGHDAFSEIDNTDLVTVVGVLPEYPGIQPRWIVSKRGRSLMFDRLAAAAGGNTKRTLGAEGPQKEWMGDPIEICQAMPTAVTDISDTVMAIYGDLRMGVTMGDRQMFEVQVLRERYAEYRQTGIIAVERFDLVCHGLGDATYAGPIVALVAE
jgi:HK97 family phage major capsid protein